MNISVRIREPHLTFQIFFSPGVKLDKLSTLSSSITVHFHRKSEEISSQDSPQIVPFAQHQIALCVQRGAHLAQPTVAASTFEAVFVPQ
jgi:hypothetical protein